jgi:hypothetical protein
VVDILRQETFNIWNAGKSRILKVAAAHIRGAREKERAVSV